MENGGFGFKGSYNPIITGMGIKLCVKKQQCMGPKRLHEKILIANPVTKSSSMVDENLHSHCLHFVAYTWWIISLSLSLFSSCDQKHSQCVPL
jgi:hypothetical protein